MPVRESRNKVRESAENNVFYHVRTVECGQLHTETHGGTETHGDTEYLRDATKTITVVAVPRDGEFWMAYVYVVVQQVARVRQKVVQYARPLYAAASNIGSLNYVFGLFFSRTRNQNVL